MLPVNLVIRDCPCLVVGGGGVALRKVQSLAEDGARVTVVTVDAVGPLDTMAEDGRIVLEKRAYSPGEAARYTLVIATTDRRDVNRAVYEDARAAGVWVNVADDPKLCTFHLTARVRRGPLQLAVASAGEAPFVVRRLRQMLERRFGPEWGEWLCSAGRFRRSVRRQIMTHPQREECYDRFFAATVDPDGLRARVPTSSEEEAWLQAPAEDHRAPEPDTGTVPTSSDGGGLVSLVGAGPGCAGLLTVRGRERLLEADAVVYDRLAASVLPCELSPDVELHCVGKTAGNHPVPQEEINALLVRLAREGRRVVRLKGGDPFVFGRGGEEGEVLHADGIPFEVIPGVTSGIAAAAWIGVPVTHRREAVRLTLLTAHEATKKDGPQVRWDLLARDPHATIVGYMGVTALPQVVEQLLAHGMDPDTPAAMVEQGTTAAQRHVVSTVAELPQAVVSSGIRPPALFIIGPTVKRAQQLDWIGRLPVAGHRVLVPSSEQGIIYALEAGGAEVVAVPLPVTPAARVVMGALPLTGCVVTSGAEVDWLHEELDGPGWQDSATAWCVGREAVQRATERGWKNLAEIEASATCAELVSSVAQTRVRRPTDVRHP